MKESSLFILQWPVDGGGYALETRISRPSPGRLNTIVSTIPPDTAPYHVLTRRGRPLKYYAPLEEHPGLARRFAALADCAADDDRLRLFANEFGLLGLDPTEFPEERTSAWIELAQGLRHVFAQKDAGDLKAACATFNEFIRIPLRPRIHYEHAKRTELRLAPDTLIGALWFQVAGELTDGTQFKKCEWCPTWFPVGKGAKFRSSRRFCSTKCRKANDYQKRKEPPK